jgi:hypothetical protein
VLSGDNLSNTLHAIATGNPDRAVHLVLTTDELDDDERGALHAVVSDASVPRAEVARRLGDALRDLGANRALVNECYRAAFYLDDAAADLLDNPLYAYFVGHRSGRLLDKWVHYFPIYQRHFAPFVGTAPKILEIGVFQGGSLDMWQRFFGPGMEIVGIDVDPTAKQLADPRITVLLGDQEDTAFLESVVAEHGPFDIIIDDGGHTMGQQIASIEALFPAALRDGGVYLVEDCHTSYWADFDAGRGKPGTFIEWAKERIDDLHSYHDAGPVHPVWTDHVDGIHCYDSIVVFDKQRRWAPFCEQVGLSEFLFLQRPTSDFVGEMLATRDAAVAEGARVAGELDEIDDARAELALIRGSWSWRVTAPIRALKRSLARRP